MSRLYIRGPASFSSGKVDKYANLYGSRLRTGFD